MLTRKLTILINANIATKNSKFMAIAKEYIAVIIVT